MILITSAAYISQGLRSEFGMLPPSMLPVQNRRLYEHQLDIVDGLGPVYLTLPRSYNLPEWDKGILSRRGVRIVAVPDGLRLGESVVYALNVAGCYEEPLYLLHGDTLFDQLEKMSDVVYVSKAQDDYSWDSADGGGDVYAGYFSFASQTLLIRKITENDYGFIKGVEEYGRERELRKVYSSGWLDFGIVNSYYRSASKLTTQRAFNDLQSTAYSITKRSHDEVKILAEAKWFESLPGKLKHYAPTVWDSGSDKDGAYYEIEYYYLSSLANLYVYGENPLFVWSEIIDSCSRFLTDLKEHSILKNNGMQSHGLYGEKTFPRLQRYAQATGIDLNESWRINGESVPSLIDIVKETDKMITRDDTRFASIMHGDFCMSNILYDFKSKSIRVIDPRGLDSMGRVTIYGDLRYDVAKLAHSVLGLYDFIIGGRFVYGEVGYHDITFSFGTEERVIRIQQLFRTKQFAGYTLKELSIYPIMIHLFLSMLPLHSDNSSRQKAMLANALRLYVEMKKGNIC